MKLEKKVNVPEKPETPSVSTMKSLDNYELMECIENGLDRFGSTIKYAVMWKMVIQKDAPKEGITEKPEAFRAALQSIFGQSSARIEEAIVEEITKRTGEDYSDTIDLVDLINAVRRQSVLVQIRS